MFKLTLKQKESLGLQYIYEQVNPVSPLGRKLLAEENFTANFTLPQLKTELNNVGKIATNYVPCRPQFDLLLHSLSQLKDICSTINNLRTCALTQVELFELKNFLIVTEKISKDLSTLAPKLTLEELSLQDVSLPLSFLDPKGDRISSFYLDDDASPILLSVRQHKRQLEKQIKVSPADQDLLQRHLYFSAEEFAEEDRIYALLSAQLRDYCDLLVSNYRVLARLDLVIAKGILAANSQAIMPIISNQLTLTDAVNPYYAHALLQRNRSFSPLTITLSHGVTVLTGANMGGKTLCAKTVALNCILAQNGYFVYCKQASIPYLQDFIFLSPDNVETAENSLGGLSYFAAEMLAVDNLVRSKTRDALYVIDEFARGTNANEGQTIFSAVTQALNAKPCFSLMSTHYDNVANYATAHYQVVGLSKFPSITASQVTATTPSQRVKTIEDSISYGIIKVDKGAPVPKDAVKICNMLQISAEIMDKITLK